MPTNHLSTTSTPGGQHRKTARSVILVDRVARTGITLGGVGIVLAILGILFFILFEALPLFLPGKVNLEAQYRVGGRTAPTGDEPTESPTTGLPGADSSRAVEEGLARRFRWHEPLQIGIDQYRELAWQVEADPIIALFDPRGGRSNGEQPIDSLSGARITAIARENGTGLTLGTSDGRLLLAEASFEAEWDGDQRKSHFRWKGDNLVRLAERGPVLHVASHRGEDGAAAACVQGRSGGSGTLFLIRQTIQRTLLGNETRTTQVDDLSSEVPEDVTALAVKRDEFYAGTATGKIYRFRFAADGAPQLEEVLEVEAGRAITSLTLLLGEITLVAGTESGGVSTWFGVREEALGNRVRPFRRIREFPPLAGPVTDLAASPRNKSFAAIDDRGTLRIFHQTTGRTLAAPQTGQRAPIATEAVTRRVIFSPKGDGLLVATAAGETQSYVAHIPHPEISFRALFGRVWYEGYPRPEYVWQSTGGSDDFEGKLSLVPLVFGTLKGTIYALLFAVPIALMAAIYTSQFMADRVRQFVKPTVEIMAALPSVVLGFLAGLFLAPHLEQMVPATFVFLVLLPVVPGILGILWQTLPGRIRGSLPLGFELVALIPVVVLTFFLARAIGPWAERILFDGSFRTWLTESGGTRYDQRNCIVVGFAMGFAVIPIIFTIVEDSLTAVPRSLIAGSMACGASRWQTAIRIILPAAGSGIFSAIMIGFGRAVGETMIVLMATGNTPIMDWSIFNGMRTLSANIAVEMPEAPYRGTLYRLLFLAGLLLLLLTSIINTGAELIRLRLKRKFGNY